MSEFYLSIALLVVSITTLIISLILLRRALACYLGLKKLLTGKLGNVKKPRKRYIVFSLVGEDKIPLESINEVLKKTFIKYYGESIYGKASPRIILYDENTGRGILRVANLFVDHAIATLGLIKDIDGKKCLIIPIRTTGTLKKAREYMLKIKL